MSEITGVSKLELTLAGGGEMGALMRSLDWSRNPLGPVETWPQSLRTVLSILLASRHPIFLWWGKDLIQFYNDAYRPILGETKHPLALGQTGRESWAEIWDVIDPMIKSVMERGESTFIEDGLLALNRNGFLEECYFTYAYSPIQDESMGVGGVFVACTENTKRVLADRRLRILSELGNRVLHQKSAVDACQETLRILSTNSHDIPFALIYLFDEEGGHAHLQGAHGLEAGGALVPWILDLDGTDGASPFPLAALRESRESIRMDLAGLPGPLPGGPWPEPSRSALVLPIRRSGIGKHWGALIVGLSPRLTPETEYLQFLDLVVGQISASLSSVNEHDQERKRSEALAALDRAKTDFFSNVSHEFRTPLTLMLGPLEDSLDDVEHALAGPQRERLMLIQRNGLRLMALVNNLLDYSRIESGRIDVAYSATDLARLTRDLAGLFQSVMEKTGLLFHIDCPPTKEVAYVDVGMWEKIIINLLSNAIKFTPSGSVSLSLKETDAHFELEVKDTGIGIPEKDLPLIFERFHRVRDARADMQEGSGIGLAMVQEFIKVHGGTVIVESVLGQGSRFLITLPTGRDHLEAAKIDTTVDDLPAVRNQAMMLEPFLTKIPLASHQDDTQPHSLLQTTSSENRPLSPIRILLADDNDDLRSYMVRLLSPRWNLTVVSDGLAAVSAISAAPPDLILMDIMMPGLDGFAVLRKIRSNPAIAHIPVILISARAGEEATLEGIEAGADDYLVKPFSSRELLVRIAARLEISESRARERAAHAEADEDRYRLFSLFMEAPAPICILKGPEHRFDFANPAFEQLVTSTTLVGKTLKEALPDIEPALVSIMDGVLQSGVPFRGTEYPISLDWGKGRIEERFFNFIYQPLRLKSGEIQGLVVYAFEVTVQVRARQETEAAGKEAQRFLSLVEQSSDFIGLADVHGRLSFINEAGRRMVGLVEVSPEHQSDLRNLVAPEEGPTVQDILGTVLEQGEWEGEIHLTQTVTGKLIPVWCNLFRLKGKAFGDGTAFAVVIRNLTQLRETEERLRHAQKMEAIGKLAGGIAHDFNNLLTATNGYADLALDLVDSEPLREYLLEIRKGGERAATLTRQLLAYSRKQVLQPKVLNLNAIVSDFRNILGRIIGEDVGLETILAPDLAWVKADPGQIEQILLNLALNARDAMPYGGTLRLETANIIVDASFAAAHLEGPPGAYVVLTMTDNGMGMSMETQARIFEPFFTTKETGKGTGLGLPSVYGILKQSGGGITVFSRQGHGSQFRSFLPAFELGPNGREEAPSRFSPKVFSKGNGNGELVLLVEDEDAVLAITKRILEGRGYQVLAAGSGEQALQIEKEWLGRIDLLLTDIMMPGMNGRALAKTLLERRAEAKILFMSGYAGDGSHGDSATSCGDHFLQKPFTFEHLLEKVSALLK